MGPPLLTYSSTAKAMLKFDPESHEVRLGSPEQSPDLRYARLPLPTPSTSTSPFFSPEGLPLRTMRLTCLPHLPPCLLSGQVRLAVDRAYQPGEAVLAWCGPQPNSRLLINYGIVDESNPYDKLPLSSECPFFELFWDLFCSGCLPPPPSRPARYLSYPASPHPIPTPPCHLITTTRTPTHRTGQVPSHLDLTPPPPCRSHHP